jgi:Ca-activated chloride channel homolog
MKFMKSRLLLFIALFCCMVGTTFRVVSRAQKPTEQDDDVIRTESDVTTILLNASDKQNRLITTLREEDVRVLEDGVVQKPFTFQRETDRPLSIALLIDVSASEEYTLPDERAAVRAFIETIMRSSKDVAAIIPFTDRAFLEQKLTTNVLNIYQALERVEVALPSYSGSGPPIGGIASGPGLAEPRQGTTAIWDAISLTSSEVLARNRGVRRRAIILLTDGQDTSSRLSMSTAIDKALETETVIYAIGIGDSKYGGVNNGELKTLAERTGGRSFFPKKGADLHSAFEQIQDELRSQYLIAYSSTNKNRNGAFRKTQIEIVNPELRKEQLKLRYRPGYFARALKPSR